MTHTTTEHTGEHGRLAAATGLGRPIDLTYRSNRIAVIGSVAAGFANGLFHLAAAGEIRIVQSLLVGVATFLAWAIGREVDPDRPSSASLAMVLAVPFLIWSGPAAGIAALALIGARVTAGTVGHRLTHLDRLVLIGAAAWAGWHPESWSLALLIAVGLVVDAARGNRVAAAGAVVGGAVVAAVRGVGPEFSLGMPALGVVLVVGLATASTLRVTRVTSLCDDNATSISTRRLSIARAGLGVAVGLSYVLSGAPLGTIAPMSAALVAVAITRWLPRREEAVAP